MTVGHPSEYWTALALGIDAENKKAEIYVSDDHSLGVAREAILRRLLIAQTPAPYAVKTGFIHRFGEAGNSLVSRQCDVLVYDPTISQPKYGIDEFVVVPDSAARLVAEVKSKLKKNEYKHIVSVWRSMLAFNSPARTFGFAFDGVAFKTFCAYLSQSINNDVGGLPECIAVHTKNYIGIRPISHESQPFYFAVKFPPGKGFEKFAGFATGYFLHYFEEAVRNKSTTVAAHKGWFNQFDLPAASKIAIAPDGQMIPGPLPV
jgi:hypothetical protein